MKLLAYLDPGNASLVLQIIVGAIAALALALKLFWGRILRLLHIRKDAPQAGPASRREAR